MIIGLTGKAGSGKDTVADILMDHSYRTPLRRDSFAAPLYAGLAAMLGTSPEALQDRATKEQPHPFLGKSPRQMLQLLGTEFARDMIHQEIWVRLAQERHEKWVRNNLLPPSATTILTDVRFENEMQMVKDSGVLVHIERPGIDAVNAHSSENSLDYSQADIHILNNSSLEELKPVVLRALGPLIGDY